MKRLKNLNPHFRPDSEQLYRDEAPRLVLREDHTGRHREDTRQQARSKQSEIRERPLVVHVPIN